MKCGHNGCIYRGGVTFSFAHFILNAGRFRSETNGTCYGISRVAPGNRYVFKNGVLPSGLHLLPCSIAVEREGRCGQFSEETNIWMFSEFQHIIYWFVSLESLQSLCACLGSVTSITSVALCRRSLQCLLPYHNGGQCCVMLRVCPRAFHLKRRSKFTYCENFEF
jgi:hypothetical protein